MVKKKLPLKEPKHLTGATLTCYEGAGKLGNELIDMFGMTRVECEDGVAYCIKTWYEGKIFKRS